MTELHARVAALEARAEAIDEKLDEVLVLLRAGKLGAAMLKWLIGVGAAATVIWTAFHVGPK